MSMRCTACAHPERDALDQALARGLGQRGVAGRFGISASAVQRHASRHLRPAIRAAIERREDLRIGTLAERLADLVGTAEAVRLQAMANGDPGLVLRAVDSERGVLADLARLVGHDSEAVRAELAEAEAIGCAVADAARRDPAIGHAVIAQLDAAGSTAANDLASAFRDLMARPALTAIAVRD